MFFNSIDFAIFLPIVFFLYWFIFNKNLKNQNILVVIASYVFYGWWDWRFLFLIIFSTLTDYLVGIYLSKTENKSRRKILLWISIIVNLLFLGFFKYYNFFVANFVAVFSLFGTKINARHLNIILPVGISFYTFQTMSYSIDVYRKKLNSTKDFISFAAFVSFFPQLVAGPIERAQNLLPQFQIPRIFSYEASVDGCRQILWGFFKKIVIADTCAFYSDMIFNNYGEYNGIVLVLGAVFFAFQIYGDFSGYSDIAIGTSRLFGFSLMKNFSFPYFSRDVAEFWRRWHISLTTWFRDYVYIPLGGSKAGLAKSVRNTLIIFLLSGFWHGANWTFILWGLLNALYFLPLLLMKKNRNYTNTVAVGHFFPDARELSGIMITFFLTSFAWIFFRSASASDSFLYISRIFTGRFLSLSVLPKKKIMALKMLPVVFFFLIEWLGRENKFAIEYIPFNKYFRWIFYYLLVGCIILFSGVSQAFIYFQF
jgi:D-alanyl-lipoteichoic acid acyltransferase DltB (MBOAT superfamily)